MSFKLKKAIIEIDYGKSFASMTFVLNKLVEHPLLGDNKFLIPPQDHRMSEHEANEQPLFNSSGQMQVIRDIGIHGVYYLYLPAGYYLDKIILDPSDIVVDIFFKADQLIYCFYNPTNHQSMKIVAHKELDDKNIARKLSVDPSDIIWRQYLIRRAIVKPEIDYPDIMTQSQVADYLQYKLKTIQNWTSEGKIPFKKVGGDPRYSKKEIDEAIESGTLGKKKKK